MKVLVIPDVHLKPWIFDQAAEIMESGQCERAVFVGDLVDDWGHESDLELYEETFKKAIWFAKKYPDTLWCYGNHELAYVWGKYENDGYSEDAEGIVQEYLGILEETVAPGSLAVVHRIDNVIFSHAGIIREFVDYWLPDCGEDVDAVIEAINESSDNVLWEGTSPIWTRPQDGFRKAGIFAPDYLQVVGHTPMRSIMSQGSLLSTDTFSTFSNGRPIGNEEMCWVDTVTKDWGPVE